MGLSGEVDDGVDLCVSDELSRKLDVGNVAANEAISTGIQLSLQIREILKVPRVSEEIEIDHSILRALAPEQFDELAADKAATAGDK